MEQAVQGAVLMARRYQELIAWQLADEFKSKVTVLVRGSAPAWDDRRYRSQLLGAAQSVPVNIVEGFLRNSPGDFRRFLTISLGSLGETESRIRDDIELGYFSELQCAEIFRLGRRCAMACVGLRKAQESFMAKKPRT